MNDVNPHDLYIKLADPSGKRPPIINEHRVWNSKRFIASLNEQYSGAKTKAEDVRVVTVVSREDYLATKVKPQGASK